MKKPRELMDCPQLVIREFDGILSIQHKDGIPVSDYLKNQEAEVGVGVMLVPADDLKKLCDELLDLRMMFQCLSA